MPLLPSTITDQDLIAFIDGWAALLEAGNYDAAYEYTEHIPQMQWTPQLMREVIESYGNAEPYQRVTVDGTPTDITQRKEVERWPEPHNGKIGEIWYDLNIDGQVSDLTATFALEQMPDGITIQLNDIHVM